MLWQSNNKEKRRCDRKLSDFNNDSFKDMAFISAAAARGANEVRRLFIYDKTKDKLVYMKNPEDYPDMLYNKTLDCIDAFWFMVEVRLYS